MELAHIIKIVESSEFPRNVADWAASTVNGWTVAHEAVLQERLPPGFDGWEIWVRGQTIAHIAASLEMLPPDFDQWGLVDRNGRTVADVAAACRRRRACFRKREKGECYGIR